MDFEKYTERSRGFIQSAQTLALREGHQKFTPEHVLKVLLDDEEGLAAGLIKAAGGGGLLVLPTGLSLGSSVAGGPAGTSDATVVKAKFPVNGATAGGGGQVLTSALLQAVGEGGAVPGVLCVGSAADVAVSISDSLAGGAVGAGRPAAGATRARRP